MATTVRIHELKKAVERKAYAYGISESVCVLLAEYVVDLITHSYAKSEKQLVQRSFGQNQ